MTSLETSIELDTGSALSPRGSSSRSMIKANLSSYILEIQQSTFFFCFLIKGVILENKRFQSFVQFTFV